MPMLSRRSRSALGLALMGLLAASCAQLADIPRLEPAHLKFKVPQSTRIYAADGSLITTLHETENRTVIPLRQVPRRVRRAVIAIEDERFYEHGGVDVKAIVRAAIENATSGEIREGGSTITQQYVKNVIIAPGGFAAKTLERKIEEAALSRQLEQELSKREILERYLNTVYFGHGTYGIQTAAGVYFGKPARRLTLAEGALLAGLIRSPQTYDPYDRPKVARQRRNVVLDKMVDLAWLAPKKAKKASREKLRLERLDRKAEYAAPYFVDYVQRLIKFDPRFRAVGKTFEDRQDALLKGGLQIYTTVNLEMQEAAEQAVDSVLTYENDPHGALVAIEPKTGYVRAMVGGREWFTKKKKDRYAKLNLAIQAEPGLGPKRHGGDAPGTGRQAGSAFKPFALAAAIEDAISLNKTYKAAACMDFPGANAGGNWHVCNYESTDFGPRLSLLEATINSVNVVYAQLILEVGPERVVEVAKDMGIRTKLQAVPSATLGTNPVNPLGMASAFGTFATGGKHHPPVGITKILNSRGKVLYEHKSKPRDAIDPAVAYITTSALQQVIEQGTAAQFGNIGRPAAGKTGTAQEWRDAWFVGYTPDLVAAVWVGYPEGEIEMKPYCPVTFNEFGQVVCRPTRIQVTGGSWPTQIWQAFMLRALAGVPASSFPAPTTGIETVVIDSRTGCLASELTPPEYRVEATFAAGTAPEEECPQAGDAAEVPDVFGYPAAEATRILESYGFSVTQDTEPSSTYPPGRVIGQEPDGGETAAPGSTVFIVVSSAEQQTDTSTVPSVLGYTAGQAQATLSNHGFNTNTVVQKESDKQAAKRRKGRVWKQAPGSGTTADQGSTVTIWVNP